MEDAYRELRLEIIRLRRLLADMENRRNASSGVVPADIWQQLVDTSHALEQAEGRLREVCTRVTAEVNLVQRDIISILDSHNRLREQMREVEELFLVNIVRPGSHLKNAIAQREYLEMEYQRLLSRIHNEAYLDRGDLEQDIQQALMNSDQYPVEESPEEEDNFFEDEVEPARDMTRLSADEVLEAFRIRELRKEFRRVVLPQVHPDTSTTPEEVFKTVFEVYKQNDTILMEAYILQYRGELVTPSGEDPLESLDLLMETRQRYVDCRSKLTARVESLKREMSRQELEQPEVVRSELQARREELLARIREEAEKILVIRQKIEHLLEEYPDRQVGSGATE